MNSRQRFFGITLTCICLVAALSQTSVRGQDWPQWRGPAGDGTIPDAGAATRWPTSYRVEWRAAVGEGYSSPVLAGGRVFVHSRTDPDEVVQAFNASDGSMLWQQRYPAPFEKNQYARNMAKGPYATPSVRDGVVFTLGASAILTAWRAASGEQRWRRDFSSTVETSGKFCGTSASPLWSGELLVVQVGSDVHGGQLLGLDPATGHTRWEWRGPGPGYASPIEITVGGMGQLVAMSERSVVGLEAGTGRELWSIPFPDEWHENIVSPVWTGRHLIVSGTRQGTHAFSLGVTNGNWLPSRAWRNADIALYMSSPVLADGVIYGFSSRKRGQFFALDAATGVVRWTSEGRDGEQASVLLGPAYVQFLTEAGELVVIERGKARFDPERRYRLPAGNIWAVPAPVGSDLIVRAAEGLVRLSAGASLQP